MLGKLRSRALGGLAAQISQALGSFVLQFVAARYLGLEGLGVFAVLNAVITLATAVASGFVGDSLTVLDRHHRATRAGLQWWLLVFAFGGGVLCTVIGAITGFLSVGATVAFGIATAAYLLEDALRRLLMATLDFWRIVVVDMAAMVASLLVVIATLAGGSMSLTALLVALTAGQVVGGVVGWFLLPRRERFFAPMRAPAIRAVAAFGTWRGLQQTVRSGTLALVRVICLLVVTDVAVGELEAARIYMAPAVLAVTGVSSYLFASYASAQDAPLAKLVAFADRTVVRLIALVLVGGALGLAVMPILGPLLTGDDYDLSVIAVAGWAIYAAAVAGVTPYGQLASVRGRHVAVFALRIADSVCSLVGIFVVVAATNSVEWAPLVMAGWSLLGGLAIRRLVLQRDVRIERARAVTAIA